MRDGRDQSGPGYFVDRFVVVGKDQYPVARVGFEDFFEYANLGGGAQRDLAVAR